MLDRGCRKSARGRISAGVRCCTQNARLRPCRAATVSSTLPSREKNPTTSTRAGQPASTATCRRPLAASLFLPSVSLPRSCPAQLPTHSYLALEGALVLESCRQNTKLRLLALSSDRNLAPCGEPSRPIIRASPLLRPSRVRLQKLLCSVWS